MNTELHSKLIDIDWQPAPRKVRQFAICLALLLVVVGWYGAPLAIVITTASLILLISWLQPAWLRPVYVVTTLITLPLGLVIGEIALLLIYFGVFLPIGWLFRLMQRDALQRQLDRHAESYWQECRDEPPKRSYLRRY